MVDHQVRRESPGAAEGETRRGRRHSRSASRALTAAREAVIVVAAALVLSLLVKIFFVQAFFIPSESMEDTLVKGDRILVSHLTPGLFDLERGDVVVFEDPGGWLDPAAPVDRGPLAEAAVKALTFVGVLPQNSGQHLVKRVIGLPGDVVACCDAQGRTTVNGAPLDEDFLKPGSMPSQFDFSVTMPPNSLWVEGDNRQHSADSRLHQGGPGGGSVPIGDVVGRALVTVWPLDRVTWLSRHESAFAGVPPPSAAAG